MMMTREELAMTTVALTANTDIDIILSDLWPFNPKANGSDGLALRKHFVTLHNQGKIKILTDNLLDENTWDRTLRIQPGDLSAVGLVKQIISPIMTIARPSNINVVSHVVNGIKQNDIIEFWWD
jgi:hypothetical protein